MKVLEEGLLAHVQSLGLVEHAWFGEAPEGTPADKPFIVLSAITCGGAREAGVLHPLVQADCYAPDIYAAVTLAETLAGTVDDEPFTSEGMRYEGVRAERTAPIRVEDGSWKVPVQIRFSVMEEQS